MGHPNFNPGMNRAPWARGGEPDEQNGGERVWRQHGGDRSRGRGRGRGGPWGDWSGSGRSGRQGPPPWITGLFGLGQEDQRRGPRVRRGDVRSAILDVLRTAATEEGAEPVNGYQVIQQISERSGGAWRPSPGSVYPTIQLLQDEGLVETDDERRRKTLALTAEGTAYVAEHADELAAVWAPFERRSEESGGTFSGLKPEIGQVMGAVWQIVTTGSESQQRAAIDILVETRRKLYGILADGDDTDDPDDPDDTADVEDEDESS
jgi:DNA-binding PadR family transcriptional regulator